MRKLLGYWYIAAPSRELGSRPIRREVEGEALVLFRDSRRAPQALVDRCAHRGMALSRGRVVGDCVECPYHGWQYSGSGALCAVPALCEGERVPQPESMRAFPVIEQDDHLWVWLGSESPRGGPPRFPRSGEAGWKTFFMHTRFEASVEDCLENFLDVPHTIFVHRGLFRGGSLEPTRARISWGPDGASAEFLNEKPLAGFGPRLVFPRGTRMRHVDRFILPSITRVDYEFGDDSAFTITSQCTQRGEFEVDVTTAITWRLPREIPFLGSFLRWYCRRVIRQDVEVLAFQGEQSRRFGRTQLHTDADLLGRHIARLRRRAAEGLVEERETVEEVTLRI